MQYLYLALAILAEVVATTSLKASEQFTKLGPTLIVVAGYGVAFYLLTLVLRTVPIGLVYAMWSGLGIVLVAVAAFFIYKQSLDVPAMIGIGLIVAGVVTMNVFSSAGGH